MARKPIAGEKPLYWVGFSKRDLVAFPEPVKDHIGTALSVAQFGGKHPSAKPWKGQGTGVLEVVEDHDRSTYRAVYTVRSRARCMRCTPFRKSHREGSGPADRMSSWSPSGSGWRSGIMRHDMAKQKGEAKGR